MSDLNIDIIFFPHELTKMDKDYETTFKRKMVL